MKYLVTGGAGFIGSHLVDRLVHDSEETKEKYEIIIIDNFLLGKIENLTKQLNNSCVNIARGDIRIPNEINDVMKGVDVVFHLAANSDISESRKSPSIDFEQGAVGTHYVLEAMKNHGVKKIVFASSSAVYGETRKFPISEDHGPLLPISFYGAAKLYGEGLISAYAENFGFQAWICRFGNVIGSRGTHGVVYDFYRKLQKDTTQLEVLGNGTQEKPYSEVKDLVDGIIFVFKNAKERLNYFQVGCDTSTSVSTIAKIILKEMNLETARIEYTGGDRGWVGDVPQVRYDVRKITSLGWKAKYSSDEAVRTGVKEYLQEQNKGKV